MVRSSRQRKKDEVREGESDEAMKTAEILKAKNIKKKPKKIMDLEEPRILLQIWVEIQGKHVRREHAIKALQEAIKALQPEQQDLEFQAEAKKDEKRDMKTEKSVKGSLDSLDEVMEAKKLVKASLDLFNKVREAERLEHLNETTQALQNEPQKIELP